MFFSRRLPPIWLVLVAFISLQAHAVTVRQFSFRSNEVQMRDGSPWLAQYEVIFPDDYDPAYQYAYVIFLHGKDGDKNFFRGLGGAKNLDALFKRTNRRFLIVAPNGKTEDDVDGYWMNAAKEQTHRMQWADFITQELIPDVEKNVSVIKNSRGRLVAGISMGGHGAFQLSLNFPAYFSATAGHSAIFRDEAEAATDFYFQFGTGADYRARDPLSLLRQGEQFPGAVYLDIGRRDPRYARTRECAQLLSSIKDQNPNFDLTLKVGTDALGAHENGYWTFHLPEYLEWYANHLPPPEKTF